MSFSVVWFKRDLRLHDHAPLCHAVENGAVVPLYIVEPQMWLQPDASRRHWLFIRESLVELRREFRLRNSDLIVRVGDAVSVLQNIREQHGAFSLYSHEETGNAWSYERDKAVAAWCAANSIDWLEFQGSGVKRRLASRDLWSTQRDTYMLSAILSPPAAIEFKELGTEDANTASPLSFYANTLPGTQRGGRSEGLAVLESFLAKRSTNYLRHISKPEPATISCSRLSAHIAFGTLSVREIEQKVKEALSDLDEPSEFAHQSKQKGLTAFLSRLAWRCHFAQKLEQAPRIETHCMHSSFEGMREPHFREDYLEAWKTGHTGYPLVDACMRSLIETGWLTFRMRAMLVSFASYNLWLDWRVTAPYLAGLFTDYEPGIHYSQFQMQSGVTGINTIRIYSPIKQSLEQDPHGSFIKKYIPELRDMDPAFIHEPWKLNLNPPGYPLPIVEQEQSVKFARAQLKAIWMTEGFKATSAKVHARLGSRKRSSRRTSKQRTSVQSKPSSSSQLNLFED
jgi:deoxyribodipyrimidine photo-lyase